MSSRLLAAAALLAVLSVTGATMVARKVGSAHPAPETAGPAAQVPSPTPGPAATEPSRPRDVFRFADERGTLLRAPGAVAASTPSPQPPPGPRLVGLVRQPGRLLAALTLGGEVELAGPGETAAGVTVLSVGEEAVRIRHADGTESTLGLP